MFVKKNWSLFLTFFLLVLCFLGLHLRWGRIPALGSFLSPFTGAFRSSPLHGNDHYETRMKGLKAKANVFRDQYGVAHIYAQNQSDLYFLQGYTVAQDRLWQMDLSTRVAAGRLSEVVGPMALKRDLFYVSIGMRESAQLILEKLMEDPQTKLALESYSAGVNAYIDSLSESEYPVEYKIIGFNPERWEPIRTAYLLEIMSHGLAGQTHDLEMTRLLKKFGVEKMNKLFPHFPPVQDPIVPAKSVTWDYTPVTKPEGEQFLSEFDSYPLYMQPEEGNGSNNWAVSGKKTKSGHPMLANDTHLEYALPNVWYEMHLNSPEMNVYGATFPAAPGIIIGFNSSISWALTNASVDVLDWYEVEFKDESLDEYRFEDEWRMARKSQETIKIRGQEPKTVDLIWTHHGVVVESKGKKALVFKWIAHMPSNTLKTFLELDKSKNYSECKNAISLYEFPAQNFICADHENIGIWHNGKHPKKYDGQGKYVLDGSKSDNDWSDWIPWEEVPFVENPESGYVRSANQAPTDSHYPYYLNWWYDDPFRALRLTELLKDGQNLVPEDFGKWQNDSKDKFAERALPILLASIGTQKLSEKQQKLIESLHRWDFMNNADSKDAAVFLQWWLILKDKLWADQMKIKESNPIYPMDSISLDVLKGNQSEWVDDVNTEAKETAADLIFAAFNEACEKLDVRLGADPETWKLGDLKQTVMKHMAGIPGFESMPLQVGGGKYNLNAHRYGDRGVKDVAKHGAVWRMVVEMGPKVHGYVNFPGGISGNPFDPGYQNFLPDWAAGKLRPAQFVSAEESKAYRWKQSAQFLPEDE